MSLRNGATCLGLLLFFSLSFSFGQTIPADSINSEQDPSPAPGFFFNNLNRDFLQRHALRMQLDSTGHSSVRPYADDELKTHKGRNRADFSAVLDGEFGYEAAAAEVVKGGTAGVRACGIFRNKVSWSYVLAAGYSTFPNYIDSSIKYSDIAPGMGRAYDTTSGYSFQQHFGYIAYSPNKIFNFQAGNDRHFWGDGYRSLFLSDFSNPFPFLKITTSVWKVKYVNLFAMLKDITASPFRKDFKNKYGTFHYLSWNASKRFSFSLFESIIWQGTDSNRARSFDVNYLNPVIFYRPVEYSLGSSDNAFLGAGFKIKAGRKMHQQFYGQVILDEFLLKEVMGFFRKLKNRVDYGWWANKQGVQLGFKSFDLFAVKNLYLQTEINAVRPYTYSHGSVQQNYGHYNQPLAHPLGANFSEWVTFLNYRFGKWMAEASTQYAVYGKNFNSLNYGGNIFVSYSQNRPHDYGNELAQGLKTRLFSPGLRIAYEIVPESNLSAEAGMVFRKEHNNRESLSTQYFYVGIRTNIMNRYRDF